MWCTLFARGRKRGGTTDTCWTCPGAQIFTLSNPVVGTTNVSVSGPISVAIGDFNNDGNQDFAATNGFPNTVSIGLGDGLGGFSGTTNVSVGTFPYSVAIGDFNNDGNQDFAAANADADTVSIRLGGCVVTPTPTPTPTPGNVCTPIITVTEGDLFPGGPASFTVTSSPGTITVDHVNAGTGLQSFTVVSATNAVVTIPPFTPGTFNPVTATFTVIDPNLPVDFTLRAASAFHAIFIRAQCPCTPSLTVTEDPTLPPGGLASFTVTSGPNSVTVDHVNAGTGLQTFTVVNQTNAVVTIPPFTPGTFDPVTATYTIINPALPVDITLRARVSSTV
ncbi:MAG: VCBS repeat-containing protein [Acidobacteria bacterium]|nr:VCBS repeat-containing protein [Acidobacteriota bacterium]